MVELNNQTIDTVDDELVELNNQTIDTVDDELVELNNQTIDTENDQLLEYKEQPLNKEDNSFYELNDQSLNINNKYKENFNIVDYSKFNYEPKEEKEDLNVNEVIKEINAIDKKYPIYRIKEVFELKYKERNSIDEISKKLNMDKQMVEESLNELLSII